MIRFILLFSFSFLLSCSSDNKNLERLFERFYRVDQTGNRSTGGSGLGLAIVKHIIDAHDEKIFIESELGVGSEFSFTIDQAN